MTEESQLRPLTPEERKYALDPDAWTTAPRPPTPVKKCLRWWGSHACSRVKGHAVKCRCSCGVERPEENR